MKRINPGTNFCPCCNSRAIKVFDSRPSEEDGNIYRRRRCEDCGARYSTIEVPKKEYDELIKYKNLYTDMIKTLEDPQVTKVQSSSQEELLAYSSFSHVRKAQAGLAAAQEELSRAMMACGYRVERPAGLSGKQFF